MTSSVMTRSLRRLASSMKRRKFLYRPEIGIDGAVVAKCHSVVAPGRRIERQQPQCRDAEILQISRACW